MTEMTARERTAAFLAEHDDQWDKNSAAEKREIIDDVLSRPDQQRPSLAVVDGKISPPEGVTGMLYQSRLSRAFATTSDDFIRGQLDTIATCLLRNTSSGKLNAKDFNAILAFVAGCGAENEMQATIAVQMALTNDAAMRALWSVGIMDVETCSNIANKLLRTFAALAETLNKLQRGGTQIVKHIHVNEGGQAIVADTFNHTGGSGKTAEQTHATEGAGGRPALPGANPLGNGVPIPRRQRKGEVQNARRH